MHRSIITIRSNTRRPRATPDASLGYHSRLLLRKGCPPPRNSTWGCTTFIPTRGRPDLEHATSRAQHSSSILYSYFRPSAILSRLDARNHSNIFIHMLNNARISFKHDQKTILRPRSCRFFFAWNFFRWDRSCVRTKSLQCTLWTCVSKLQT